MTSKNEQVVVSRLAYIPISSIVFGERIRENYEVESLAENIRENGQLVPICVVDLGVGKYKLWFGGRRIRALESLGKHDVRAEIFDNDKDCPATTLLKQEGAENFIRKPHEFSEAMKYTKIRMEELNKTPDIKGRKDEIIAREIGWARGKLAQALFIEQKAIPEIKAAIGTDKGLSVFGAYKIAQLSKKQQIQALNNAKNFYDSEGDDLSKYNISRRKKKRMERFKRPEKYKPHPVYHIVRVAPNWDEELFTDIANTPVLNYMKEKQAFCIIEAPALHLDSAMSLLPLWGLSLDSLITTYDPKQHIGISIAMQHPHYFIIAKNCDKFDLIPRDIVSVSRVSAVFDRVNDDVFSFLNHIFPGTEKRICMSSLSGTDRWISFKASYGFIADDEPTVDPEE